MFRKMILKSVHVPIMGRSKKRKHFIVGVGASPRIRTPCTLLFGPGDFSNLEVSLYSTDPGIRWSNLDENWTVSQVMSFMHDIHNSYESSQFSRQIWVGWMKGKEVKMNGTSQALEHIHGKSVAYRVTWTGDFQMNITPFHPKWNR